MEDSASVGPFFHTKEAAYKRARRLDHPDRLDPVALCEQVLDQSVPDWRNGGGEDAQSMLSNAQSAMDSMGVFALNVCARLALARAEWKTAHTLASEVVARDHHDLLAQRVIDASDARSRDLVSPVENWLSERFCTAPYEEMETRENGDVHFCCSAWQPVPIGRLDDDGGNPWVSRRAAEIRRSVKDGDFSYCSRWHCPRIAARRLPLRSACNAAPVVPAAPKRVILSHDRSCNLACPSCRTKILMADRPASERLDELYESKLRPLVDAAETIKVTGSGDPFGSRHFRKVVGQIATGKQRRLQLQTNGLLLDERAWNELDLWGSVKSVWVSVDAARAETYAELRGGDFLRLLDNLRFLGILREQAELPFFRLDMVVQRQNFDEMGEFVDLAQRVGADGIYLLRLRNWGTYSSTEFQALDVCHPDHPEHAKFLERLKDPRLGAPGVELGSLAPFRRTDPCTGPDRFEVDTSVRSTV